MSGDFVRLVIGVYAEGEKLRSAMRELRNSGLSMHQICTVGSIAAFAPEREWPSLILESNQLKIGCVDYCVRKVRNSAFMVSSAALFDSLWCAATNDEGPLTKWMTPAQSATIWKVLCDDQTLLMVNAISTAQQIICSKIQLMQGPKFVQAYNFAVH